MSWNFWGMWLTQSRVKNVHDTPAPHDKVLSGDDNLKCKVHASPISNIASAPSVVKEEYQVAMGAKTPACIYGRKKVAMC